MPRDAIEIGQCWVCGQRVVGNAGLCAHHAAMSTKNWAVGNRILCDFFHRGIAPPRLPAADRIDKAIRRLVETA